MEGSVLTRDDLQRILQESRRRSEQIRARMEWIDRHRRELWKRMDHLRDGEPGQPAVPADAEAPRAAEPASP